MNLVLLGPPGAGKGTQSVRIARRRSLAHLSSGDILRAEHKAGTALGKKAQGFMDAGALVPDDLILAMMADYIGRPEAAGGFVLDGFPRTVAQAGGLDSKLSRIGKRIDRVVHVRVDSDKLIERLSSRWYCPVDNQVYNTVCSPPRTAGVCDACGGALAQRPDDRADVVLHRLRTYDQQTTPVIGYYSERGLLREIDGGQDVNTVTAAIEAALA